MSTCYISSGIEIGCSDGLGGISKVYILGGSTGATISGLTYNADGEITGATGNGTLYGFNVKRNTSSLVQTTTKSYENSSVFWEQVLTIVAYKYDQEKRNLLKVLGQNDELKIIAIDQNDTAVLLGEVNGMFLSGGDANSGTALGDGSKYNFIFSGQEPEPARVIDGALATVFSGFTISG